MSPEKLIDTQLIKKFPAFLEPERSLLYSQELATDSFLSQLNPVHAIIFYVFRI
jgi:hypothetical protein